MSDGLACWVTTKLPMCIWLLNVAVDVFTPKALPLKFREQVIAEAQAL